MAGVRKDSRSPPRDPESPQRDSRDKGPAISGYPSGGEATPELEKAAPQKKTVATGEFFSASLQVDEVRSGVLESGP